MTTIPPFAAGSYTVSRNTSQLLALKSQLSDLTNQLSSGLTSQTYGGLGGARTTALSAQASISALNGYSSVIDTAQTRAKLGTTSLSQVVSVASATNSTLQNGLQSTSLDTQAAKSTALNNLNAALDALNQSDGSVYLFGGKKGSTQPVADAGAILYGTSDGTKTLDGLQTIVQQQVDADVGPNGDGRVTQTYVANSTMISLAEGPSARVTAQNGGAFGFQLTDVKATGTAIGVSPNPSGQATLSVNGQPVQGDTVTVKLTLPDNTTTTITLTAAAANAPTTSTTFTIGATPSATAKNLNDTLSAAIKNAASTTLSANATARATTDFFAASTDANTTPKRVYADATTGGPTYLIAKAAAAPSRSSPSSGIRARAAWIRPRGRARPIRSVRAPRCNSARGPMRRRSRASCRGSPLSPSACRQRAVPILRRPIRPSLRRRRR